VAACRQSATNRVGKPDIPIAGVEKFTALGRRGSD
jgi:hypothetical protein